MSYTANISMSTTARDRVERYLARKLATVRVGESLPSVRQMMSDCQVSQVTVQAVLDRLREQGVVEAKPRRGIFKSRQTPDMREMTGQLDLIYCGLARQMDRPTLATFHAELFAHLGRVCGERWQGLRLHALEAAAELDAFARIIARGNCQACIVVATPRSEVHELFEAQHVPVVHLFPVSAQLPSHSIVIDPAEVVGQQVEHLLRLGHRKIAYLHSVEEGLFHRDLVLRREQFYKMMLEKRLPFHPQWVQYVGESPEQTIQALKATLVGPDRPTAAIMPDTRIPVAYHTLYEMGMQVGRDFSIVGTDDLALASSLHPPATSLRVPRRRAVQMALDSLDQLLIGQPLPETQRVPVELIARQSTGEAPR